MSRSIHITRSAFKNLTKDEIDSQVTDLHSDLAQWTKKSTLKNQEKKKRKGIKRQTKQ